MVVRNLDSGRQYFLARLITPFMPGTYHVEIR
jgi:hypothetical protein